MANEFHKMMNVSKLAVKRDNSYPVGVAALMHCDCVCGAQIAITGEGPTNACTNCGLVVDGRGWIIKPGVIDNA